MGHPVSSETMILPAQGMPVCPTLISCLGAPLDLTCSRNARMTGVMMVSSGMLCSVIHVVSTAFLELPDEARFIASMEGLRRRLSRWKVLSGLTEAKVSSVLEM